MEFVTFKDKKYKIKKGSLTLRNKGINDISEIGGLQDFIGLKELDLSNNNITEIKNLERFDNLYSLNLSNNNISEIQGLENLRNLRYLRLSNNNIREIKGLESNRKLMTLYLNGNQINEIKGLDNLLNLNALYLIGNNITEIKGIEHIPNLRRFDLGGTDLIPKETRKKLKAQGIHTKDQNYFGKRTGKIFLWYCFGIFIASLITTWAIVGGFQMQPTAILPVFGMSFVIWFICAPLLYGLGKIYTGY